jgi:NADPH:quinone reductase-like Zn-dependent oxidoreductase
MASYLFRPIRFRRLRSWVVADYRMRIFYLIVPSLVLSSFSALAATEPAVATMKAIVIHSYGGPEVLKYEDAPRPEPREDQVLIRVMAAAVNPVDVAIREGRFTRGALPLIPGMDVAGIVEKTGRNVTKFKKGDAVYAYLSFQEQGGYAEFAAAREDEVALKPKEVDFDKAAAVPLAATTAWQALMEKAQLAAG